MITDYDSKQTLIFIPRSLSFLGHAGSQLYIAEYTTQKQFKKRLKYTTNKTKKTPEEKAHCITRQVS